MKIKLIVILSILLLAAIPALSGTHSVTLAWDRSSGTNVIGYKVYWGRQSATYTNFVDVGNATNSTIPNLELGTYFFAATAYNSDGLESDYSNEAVATLGASGSPPASMRIIGQ